MNHFCHENWASRVRFQLIWGAMIAQAWRLSKWVPNILHLWMKCEVFNLLSFWKLKVCENWFFFFIYFTLFDTTPPHRKARCNTNKTNHSLIRTLSYWCSSVTLSALYHSQLGCECSNLCRRNDDSPSLLIPSRLFVLLSVCLIKSSSCKLWRRLWREFCSDRPSLWRLPPSTANPLSYVYRSEIWPNFTLILVAWGGSAHALLRLSEETMVS